MKTIYIKSTEPETEIVYTFLISEEDALKILNSQHKEDEYISINNGRFCFKDGDTIMIQTRGAGGYLKRNKVINQIKAQIFK